MFKIELTTDNAAFDGEAGVEVARILDEVARLLIDGARDGRARDVNGNVVGTWMLTDADEDAVAGGGR
jgi:hypothetical protein